MITSINEFSKRIIPSTKLVQKQCALSAEKLEQAFIIIAKVWGGRENWQDNLEDIKLNYDPIKCTLEDCPTATPRGQMKDYEKFIKRLQPLLPDIKKRIYAQSSWDHAEWTIDFSINPTGAYGFDGDDEDYDEDDGEF